jgi:hypothetical protein
LDVRRNGEAACDDDDDDDDELRSDEKALGDEPPKPNRLRRGDDVDDGDKARCADGCTALGLFSFSLNICSISGDLDDAGGGERGKRMGEPAWMLLGSLFLAGDGGTGALPLLAKRLLTSRTCAMMRVGQVDGRRACGEEGEESNETQCVSAEVDKLFAWPLFAFWRENQRCLLPSINLIAFMMPVNHTQLRNSV